MSYQLYNCPYNPRLRCSLGALKENCDKCKTRKESERNATDKKATADRAAQVEPTVPTIRFGDWQCSLSFCCYGNDRTAIRLLDVADGSPVAVATVNIPEAELGDNEVIIKDYSENEGILDSLVAAGVVQDTGKRVRSGFITAPVCELLVKVPDQDHLERA